MTTTKSTLVGWLKLLFFKYKKNELNWIRKKEKTLDLPTTSGAAMRHRPDRRGFFWPITALHGSRALPVNVSPHVPCERCVAWKAEMAYCAVTSEIYLTSSTRRRQKRACSAWRVLTQHTADWRLHFSSHCRRQLMMTVTASRIFVSSTHDHFSNHQRIFFGTVIPWRPPEFILRFKQRSAMPTTSILLVRKTGYYGTYQSIFCLSNTRDHCSKQKYNLCLKHTGSLYQQLEFTFHIHTIHTTIIITTVKVKSSI